MKYGLLDGEVIEVSTLAEADIELLWAPMRRATEEREDYFALNCSSAVPAPTCLTSSRGTRWRSQGRATGCNTGPEWPTS